MNSGKDGYIFDPKAHPYFKVAPKDKPLAKENFNLPIPPPIEPKVEPLKKDADIEKRLAKVKEEAKRMHETGEAKTLRDLRATVRQVTDETNRTIDEANLLAKRRGFYDPDTVAVREKAEKLIEKRNALIGERNKARLAYESKVTDILQNRNPPSKFKLNASPTQYKSIERLRDSDDAFRRIVGDKLLGENVSIGVNTLRNTKDARAFYRSAENAISITKVEDIGTITHELAHGLEYHNKGYFEKVKEYYAKRTKGDTLERLRDLTGNNEYKITEVTKKDKFREPYIGKWYTNSAGEQRASELTSMWFSEAYEDLYNFIETDPDYFEHFYKLFNE
jgi:hypothetical protein